MTAILLALFCCLCWGVADFLGGYNSRHLPTLFVLLISTAVGLVTIVFIVAFSGRPMPHDPALLWGIGGGLAGTAALFMLYRALAIGTMAVLLPICASGVILPVLFGILTGERPETLQIVGIVSAIAGSLLAARERDHQTGERKATRGVGLAIGSAFGVGFFFIFMDQASSTDPYWATLVMRIAGLTSLLAVFMIMRPQVPTARRHLKSIGSMGVIDTLGGIAFTVATSVGMLSIVSVLGSLYPVVTIILSMTILKERPHWLQFMGIGLALTGICLISAG